MFNSEKENTHKNTLPIECDELWVSDELRIHALPIIMACTFRYHTHLFVMFVIVSEVSYISSLVGNWTRRASPEQFNNNYVFFTLTDIDVTNDN